MQSEILNKILNFVTSGARKTVINYPNFGKVNVEITRINLELHAYLPIRVKILDTLYKKEYRETGDMNSFSFVPVMEEYNIKWLEEDCKLEWFVEFC